MEGYTQVDLTGGVNAYARDCFPGEREIMREIFQYELDSRLGIHVLQVCWSKSTLPGSVCDFVLLLLPFLPNVG